MICSGLLEITCVVSWSDSLNEDNSVALTSFLLKNKVHCTF